MFVNDFILVFLYIIHDGSIMKNRVKYVNSNKNIMKSGIKCVDTNTK